MARSVSSAKRRQGVSLTLLILGIPLIMGQLEDCLPELPPKFSAEPLALDCVSNGTQVFMPLDMSVVAARAPIALTGTLMETMVTAEIPPAMFCALADAQATQTDIDSAAIGIKIDGTMPPGDTFALHTAVNLPIQSIDIAAACGGTGPAIVIDFGMVQTAPWADGWTMDFTVGPPQSVLILLRNIDLPGLPIPGPTVNLLDFCDPTDKSQPPNGTTDDPEDSPRIAADRDGDGDYESLATAIDQISFDIQGWCRGYRCDDGNDCTIDHCDRVAQGWCTWDNEPIGTACELNGEAGACDGAGTCFVEPDPGPCDPLEASCTRTLSLGCTQNVTGDVAMVDVELTVTADPLIGGTTVPVHYAGVFRFPEVLLDGAQPAVPGGVTFSDLIEAKATVHVRSGATSPDSTLSSPVPVGPGTCLIPPATCDPANDGPSVPGLRSNTDCVPTGTFNPCQHVIAFPTSSDCSPGGTCELLGKTVQCQSNGFCITGDLLIPLAGVDSSVDVEASGVVSFGWDDQSTGATLNPDGTYDLPLFAFTDPLGPNGIKLNETGLAIALQCTMAVPSDGPLGPVPPVPGQSSPTPDFSLLQFPIQ